MRNALILGVLGMLTIVVGPAAALVPGGASVQACDPLLYDLTSSCFTPCRPSPSGLARFLGAQADGASAALGIVWLPENSPSALLGSIEDPADLGTDDFACAQ